jgi:hypothetical protein
MRALITPRFPQEIEVWRSFPSKGQFPNETIHTIATQGYCGGIICDCPAMYFCTCSLHVTAAQLMQALYFNPILALVPQLEKLWKFSKFPQSRRNNKLFTCALDFHKVKEFFFFFQDIVNKLLLVFFDDTPVSMCGIYFLVFSKVFKYFCRLSIQKSRNGIFYELTFIFFLCIRNLSLG